MVTLDSPYLGSANATAPFSGGQLLLTASNGSVTGYFQLYNWTIYQQASVPVSGWGTNEACPAFVTVGTPIRTFTGSVEIWSAGQTGDSQAPDQITLQGYSSVRFPDQFGAADSVPVSTCSTGTDVRHSSSSLLSITVPFLWNGTAGTVATSVGLISDYTYDFPAGSGTWSVDAPAVGNGASGGGWAFQFQPC